MKTRHALALVAGIVALMAFALPWVDPTGNSPETPYAVMRALSYAEIPLLTYASTHLLWLEPVGAIFLMLGALRAASPDQGRYQMVVGSALGLVVFLYTFFWLPSLLAGSNETFSLLAGTWIACLSFITGLVVGIVDLKELRAERASAAPASAAGD
jgi:hypothetical protein